MIFLPEGPIVWLREINAVTAALFIPIVFYVLSVSNHRGKMLYRYGLMAAIAGLMADIAGVFGIVPNGFEIWMFKNLAIYFCLGTVAWDYWHGNIKKND